MIVEKISTKSQNLDLALTQGDATILPAQILYEANWPTREQQVNTTNTGSNLIAICGYDFTAYTSDLFTTENYAGGVLGDGFINGLYRGGSAATAIAPATFLGLPVTNADFRYFSSMIDPGTDYSFTAVPVAGSFYDENNLILACNNDGNDYGTYSSVGGTATIGIYNWTAGVEINQILLGADAETEIFGWGEFAALADGASLAFWTMSATPIPTFFKDDGSYFYLTLDDANLQAGVYNNFYGTSDDNRAYYGLIAADGDYYIISFAASGDEYIAYRLGSGYDLIDVFFRLTATDILIAGELSGDPVQYSFSPAISPPGPPTTGLRQYNVGSGPAAPILKLGCTNYCLPLNGAK